MEIKEMYDRLIGSINEIDVVLDSQGDQKAATRRKVQNEYIEDTKELWTKISGQLTTQFEQLPAEKAIGFFYGLMRELERTTRKGIDEKLTTVVDALPKPEQAEKLTDEQVKELSTARSDLFQKIKNLIATAQNFDLDVTDMPMPSKRTGGRGPRGKRATSYVTWFIDDEQVSVGDLKVVVEKYSQYSKVSELTAAIRESGVSVVPEPAEGEKGVNLTTPPDEFSFSLPDGKTLTGKYNPPAEVKEEIASQPVSDDDDPDDDSDLDSDD